MLGGLRVLFHATHRYLNLSSFLHWLAPSASGAVINVTPTPKRIEKIKRLYMRNQVKRTGSLSDGGRSRMSEDPMGRKTRCEESGLVFLDRVSALDPESNSNCSAKSVRARLLELP